MTASNQVPPAKRLSSGIPGLDTILQGGFFYENLYLVLGPPGAGKTILANQICFYHAARGNKAIYLTLLAESHGAMLQHIRELAFCDFDLVSKSFQYYSGYKPLEEAGLDGLLEFLHDIMTQESPSIIVVDGMATVEAAVQHEIDFKRFVHQLQLLSSTYSCTTFLLTHAYMENAIQPEHTMVDGILVSENCGSANCGAVFICVDNIALI